MSDAARFVQLRATAQALHELFRGQQEPVVRSMVTVDPWSAAFTAQAQAALGQAAAPLWAQVRAALPGLTEVAALQQAWSVVLRKPLWCGMLYRASLEAGGTDLHAEAVRLRDLTLQRWRKAQQEKWPPMGQIDPIASLLLGATRPEDPAPNLAVITALPGSVRLRYRLAWHCREGATLRGLISSAAHQPSATDYQRRVELDRALERAVASGRRFRPLREVEVAMLHDKSRALLLALPHWWPVTLPQALRERPDLAAHVQDLAAERVRVEDVLDEVMQAVRGRRLAELDALVAQADDGPIAMTLWGKLRGEPWGLEDDHAHASLRPEFGPWVPTSAQTLDRLRRHAPRPLPSWWALSASEVAQWLLTPDLEDQLAASFSAHPSKAARTLRIPVQDLAPLQRTWSPAEQAALLRAGLTRYVPDSAPGWDDLSLQELAHTVSGLYQRGRSLLAKRLKKLPDARPWLALMAQSLVGSSTGEAAGPDAPEVSSDNAAARELRDLARQTIDEHFRGLWAHTWGRWVVSCAGTPVWRRVRHLALERTRLLDDTLSLLEDRRTPLNPPGLRLAVAQALHDPRQVPREPVQALHRWLQLDPDATPVLAAHGPVNLLLDLAASPKTPLPVLLALVEHGPASAPADQGGSVRMAAWRAKLRRVGSVERLTELVLHPPEQGAWVWSAHWPLLAGRTSTGTADTQGPEDQRNIPQSRTLPRALVLAARRSGWRLIELHAQLGPSVFNQALADARALLEPTAPREAATLELTAALGVKVAPHLMRALAMAQRGAPPGHKLDRAYQRHLLPKKNGGSRVISAPEAALKRVQRAVLERLVQPLGQHEAAHGFVPGRGIVGNAQVHVGQSVVVNADVRSCFPSVKWPLVLAALRRDLGAAASSGTGPRLSPVAISLLCDLCTSEGGLPIGAPTSPSLLNRVLLKTDEILTAAATARGVSYTRYADDLSFSGGDAAVQMLGIARRTLGQIGLELDQRKTNIFRRGRRQVVTGLVVNDQVGVPRRIRRRLRAAVHQVEQGKPAHWHGQEQGLDALQGRLAFVHMVHAEEGAALIKRLRAATPPKEPA